MSDTGRLPRLAFARPPREDTPMAGQSIATVGVGHSGLADARVLAGVDTHFTLFDKAPSDSRRAVHRANRSPASGRVAACPPARSRVDSAAWIS
jgi:UDP-N-acetylmuramoylalanine-D-glutamate ligase